MTLRIQTLARELALKALYQFDLLGTLTVEDLRRFCHENASDPAASLAIELIEECIRRQGQLDAIIARTAQNWQMDRMPACDRNIMRMGVCELLYRPRTPPKVAINEAIELAKKYSTENSPTFVNGVLDRIYNTHILGAEISPDPAARADLHVHSTASDGSCCPAEVVQLAVQAGLSAIALTDHDTVAGVAEARQAGVAEGIVVVPGVELTAYGDRPDGGDPLEIHIAGLFVAPDDAALRDALKTLRTARVERVGRIAEKLLELGLALDVDGVLARAAGEAVGRVHVAQELIAAGHCETMARAFDLYLANGGPAYVPKQIVTPAETLKLIKEAGGCSVLCHPCTLPEADKWIRELAGNGLDAIEVHYPSHSPQQEKELMDLAAECGLGISGGSDFHGTPKPDIEIGRETVSFVELCDLKQRAGS